MPAGGPACSHEGSHARDFRQKQRSLDESYVEAISLQSLFPRLLVATAESVTNRHDLYERKAAVQKSFPMQERNINDLGRWE